MTLSMSPQYRAFSRTVMDEKSLSPLFAVVRWGRAGAVVTNDWCITEREHAWGSRNGHVKFENRRDQT